MHFFRLPSYKRVIKDLFKVNYTGRSLGLPHYCHLVHCKAIFSAKLLWNDIYCEMCYTKLIELKNNNNITLIEDRKNRCQYGFNTMTNYILDFKKIMTKYCTL